jgi:Tfp pilus assembly protein PilO
MSSIWREKRVLLIVLAVLLAANTIFFFTYRVQYENRLRALDSRLDDVKAELEDARRTRLAAEQQVAAYRKIERDIRQVYDQMWSTEGQRLTRLITEVKRLTVQSQLAPPRSLSFQRAVMKGTTSGPNPTVVGISFTVEGRYQQVRQLINKLELSNQFVIIDQIGLSSETGENLTMSIHVKTLFRDTAAPRRPIVNQEL